MTYLRVESVCRSLDRSICRLVDRSMGRSFAWRQPQIICGSINVRFMALLVAHSTLHADSLPPNAAHFNYDHRVESSAIFELKSGPKDKVEDEDENENEEKTNMRISMFTPLPTQH